MAIRYEPVVPVGRKPTLASFGGPGTVPGNWWKDAKLIIPLLEGGGTSGITEYVRQLKGTASGTPSWTTGKFGTAFQNPNNGDDVAWPLGAQYALSGDVPFTIAVAYKQLSTAGFPGILCFRNSFSTGMWELYGDNSGTNNMSFAWHDGTIRTLDFTATGLDTENGEEAFYILERLIGGTYRIYKNGVFFAEATDATNVSFVSGSQQLVIGNLQQGLSSNQRRAEYHCVYMWDRLLTGAEKLQLKNDHFAPVRSYTYRGSIDTAAAPAPAPVRRQLMTLGVGR